MLPGAWVYGAESETVDSHGKDRTPRVPSEPRILAGPARDSVRAGSDADQSRSVSGGYVARIGADDREFIARAARAASLSRGGQGPQAAGRPYAAQAYEIARAFGRIPRPDARGPRAHGCDVRVSR